MKTSPPCKRLFIKALTIIVAIMVVSFSVVAYAAASGTMDISYTLSKTSENNYVVTVSWNANSFSTPHNNNPAIYYNVGADWVSLTALSVPYTGTGSQTISGLSATQVQNLQVIVACHSNPATIGNHTSTAVAVTHVHTFTEETVKNEYLQAPVTCTTAATYYKSCPDGTSSVGTSDEATFSFGSALGHDYQPDAARSVAATCTADGLAAQTCTHDAAHQNDTALAALGHDYQPDAARSVAATCTVDGLAAQTCTHDAAHHSDTVLAALGHSWSEWITVTQASATEAGLEKCVCYRCEVTQFRSIAPTGVISETGVSTQAAVPQTNDATPVVLLLVLVILSGSILTGVTVKKIKANRS